MNTMLQRWCQGSEFQQKVFQSRTEIKIYAKKSLSLSLSIHLFKYGGPSSPKIKKREWLNLKSFKVSSTLIEGGFKFEMDTKTHFG